MPTMAGLDSINLSIEALESLRRRAIVERAISFLASRCFRSIFRSFCNLIRPAMSSQLKHWLHRRPSNGCRPSISQPVIPCRDCSRASQLKRHLTKAKSTPRARQVRLAFGFATLWQDSKGALHQSPHARIDFCNFLLGIGDCLGPRRPEGRPLTVH